MWIDIFSICDCLCVAVLISMVCIYKKNMEFAGSWGNLISGSEENVEKLHLFNRLHQINNWTKPPVSGSSVYTCMQRQKGIITGQRTDEGNTESLVECVIKRKVGKIAGEAGGLTQHTHKSSIPTFLSMCLSGTWVALNSFIWGSPHSSHCSSVHQSSSVPVSSPSSWMNCAPTPQHCLATWIHPLTLPGTVSGSCVTTARLCPLSLDPVELCSDLGGDGLCWGHPLCFLHGTT